MKNRNSYTTAPFTLERVLVEDANRIGKKIHHLYGIGEADVTDVRKKIRTQNKNSSEKYSLSTYILYCLVQTIEENKSIQAQKSWRRKLYIFDDIDVFFPIETKNNILIPKVLRAANRKSIFELEREINKTKSQKDLNLDIIKRIFLRYPKFLRNIIYNVVMKVPKYRKDTFGTVYYTSTLFSSDFLSAGIPAPMHSIGAFVGSIHKKVVLKDGIPAEKEFVSVTIVGDHDIVDGGEFCRFGIKLRSNIESLINKIQ